jgi:C-terminal processing protease CtpA/Prc
MLLTCISPRCTVDGKTIPVALLISPATGSSGEFLAIAFKGRDNTVFVGSKTAGYVTGIQGFGTSNSLFLLISTSYGIDRKGRVYQEAISPDIYLKDEDSFNDIEHDKKVLKASEWIQTHK